MASTNDFWDKSSTLICATGGTALQVLAEVFKDSGTAVSTGAIAGAWMGPLGVVAGAIGGFGVNRLSSWLDKRKESRDALKDFLTNHDIALSQARCVQQRLREYTKECRTDPTRREYADMIEALAKDAERWWLNLVNNPARKDLEGLRDAHAVEHLTSYLADGDAIMLDPATWRAVIGKASAGMRDPRLEGPILDKIAAYVAGHFKHDWVEALKVDFQTDGKAYAAVSLRYFSEILAAVKQGQGFDEETKALLKRMPEFANDAQALVDRLKEAKAALLAIEDLPGHLRDIVEGTELRLLDAISKEGRETRRQLSATEKRVIGVVLLSGLITVAIVLALSPPSSEGSFSTLVRIDQAPGGKILTNYPGLQPEAQLTLNGGNYNRVLEIGKGGDLKMDDVPSKILDHKVQATLVDRYWKVALDSIVLRKGEMVVELVPNGVLETVEGRVVNENGKGLEATVVSISGDTTVTTGIDGTFSIKLAWKHQRKEHKLYLLNFGSGADHSTYLPESEPATLVASN
ncbi:MAG: hypothetical protein KF905_09225 [Flavobacteriales bacterium]|nr:hypothetical protein [Flavobacteriales bacterium]